MLAMGGTATAMATGAKAYAQPYANAYGLNAGSSSTITVGGDAIITVQARGGTATSAYAYAYAKAYGL
ncbi:MAG: hypothetical protein LUC29_10405 [Acidaminococcaceae bacterium]|nr:hypothetical protein [Acidaminococcaceae bacterium]